MNVLKIDNLSYSYGKFKVLNNISFQVNDGVVGILGPNGAGKTTLIKLIATLYSTKYGNIKLNNIDYKNNTKEIRGNIGYLPQEFTTYSNIKGREFLEIIASLKMNDGQVAIKKEINKVIKELNMENYIDKKVKEYSGGMKQKLGFAQVLIGNPKLVIVDEPTVGLDPEQRSSIRQLLPKVSKDRILIVTTHIIEDIEDYCNYLLVIKDGGIIYTGTTENFIKAVEKMVWEVEVDLKGYEKILKNNKVLKTIIIGERVKVKYVSKLPLTVDSVQVKITLEDAYIIHSSLGEN